MSTKAPILNSEEVVEAFKKAQQDPNFAFLKVGINLEKNQFELKKVEGSAIGGNDPKNWEKMHSTLEDNNHSYLIIKDPWYEKMFVLLHWGPDSSSVKQRLIYASSRAALKGYLGQSFFTTDYYLNNKDECKLDTLIAQRQLQNQIDFRSDLEMDSCFTPLEYEIPTKSAQIAIIQRLPIEISTTATECLEKYRKNESKVVLFKLSEDKKSIMAEEQKEDSISGIRESLPDNEPRYLIFWHTRVRKDEKIPKAPTVRVFGYYCPENCDRSLKFAYSTCKANLVEYCHTISLTFEGKVEVAEKADFTHEFLDYHVFPILDDKQMFDAPKPASRKKRTHKRKKLDLS